MKREMSLKKTKTGIIHNNALYERIFKHSLEMGFSLEISIINVFMDKKIYTIMSKTKSVQALLHELVASSSVGSPSSNTANCSERFSSSL